MDYFDDLLVWAIILAILATVARALFKRHRISIILLGLLLFLGAFPVAVLSEISINGCCGAPTTGNEGVGYLIGGLLAIAGISIVVFSKRLAGK